MAFSNDHENLARLGADSAKHIAASDSSIRQTREHIASSRKAIARSLRTLATAFYSPGE